QRRRGSPGGHRVARRHQRRCPRARPSLRAPGERRPQPRHTADDRRGHPTSPTPFGARRPAWVKADARHRARDRRVRPKPVTIGAVSLPDPVKVKNTLTYQITLRNQGAVDAAGVVLQTAFSDTITPVSADPRCAVTATTARCTVGQLPAGASATLSTPIRNYDDVFMPPPARVDDRVWRAAR